MKHLLALPILLALGVGCSHDDKGAPSNGLLRADDLGSSWVQGSDDEPLGFDTGCIAVAWGSKAPQGYRYANLVNPAAARTGSAPLSVDEYLVPISDAGAVQTLKDFQAAIPQCANSVRGSQVEPERLTPLPGLPDVVATAQRPSMGLVGDVGPDVGRSWSVLAAAPGRGLVWLTVTGGDAQQVASIAQTALRTAARDPRPASEAAS
jgi:hypothetical protein